jgi:hypothetical protein
MPETPDNAEITLTLALPRSSWMAILTGLEAEARHHDRQADEAHDLASFCAEHYPDDGAHAVNMAVAVRARARADAVRKVRTAIIHRLRKES